MTSDKTKTKIVEGDETLTDGETVFHPKVWGGEYWIVNKEYCGKKLMLNKQYRCSIHHHKVKDETFLVISGKVLMEIGDEKKVMYVGDKQYIPIGVKHRFTGLEDSEIVEFSTHHLENDSYRDVESGKVPDEEFAALCNLEFQSEVSINKFKEQNVLVVGDIMLDIHKNGIVERVMPDAPSPIVKINDVQYFLGGSGNVISNIKSLGGKVTFIGFCGKDDNAKKMQSLLDEQKIDAKLYDLDYPTISKTSIIATRANAECQKLLRIDTEEKVVLSSFKEDEIISFLKSNLKDKNVVIISDYNKGMCTERICKELISACKKENIPVIVDPKGKNWDKYKGATIAKPNVEELGVALSAIVENENDEVQRYGKELFAKSGLEYLLVSRSEKGVALFTKNENEPFCLLPTTDNIVNVSGAGDSMVACLALGMGSKMNIKQAVKVANICAGCACAKPGTTAVSFDELNYKISLKEEDSKIIDVSALQSLIGYLKNEGKKIVFTNGYFDTINNNFIEHFKQAKALGDVLIIGVNSDTSANNSHVKLLNNEAARLMFLSNISIIDYLITFDSDNPNYLLNIIRPDVIVKGGNLKPNEIVGKEYAKEAVILPYIS